jgi:hypothetical protein
MLETLIFVPDFRKGWQQVVQFPGKAREMAKAIFGESVLFV